MPRMRSRGRLIVWTLLIWLWMYATRIPAMQKAGIQPQDARFPGSLDKLPDSARQVADNYNHLFAAPTVFYAVALGIVAAGLADPIYAACAWAFLGVRVLHSLTQATFNRVAVLLTRFDRGEITWDRVVEECLDAIDVTETTERMLHRIEGGGLHPGPVFVQQFLAQARQEFQDRREACLLLDDPVDRHVVDIEARAHRDRPSARVV